MTKKNKRRGFTIVELVIVIAVIAILAAVLIPTYVNLVKKANEAKAQAEAKNLVTEMLTNIILGNKDSADLLVFSKKGNDVYLNGYSAEQQKFLTYRDNPFALKTDIETTAQAAVDELLEKGVIERNPDVDNKKNPNDWRLKENVKTIIETLSTKYDVVVYANYIINADKFAPHVHTWETAWMFDETYHWHKCAGCDEITGKAKHVFGDDGKCKDCGHVFNTGIKNVDEFKAAIRAAKPGDTIRLGADITGTSKFVISKELTIDLNGHALSNTDFQTLCLKTGANVTVIDSSIGQTGIIKNEYTGKQDPTTIDLYSNGVIFTLKSGKVQSNSKDDFYYIAIGSSKKVNCTVNIYGGTVANCFGHERSRAIIASKGMRVNIYDGIINGGMYALDVYAGSVSNIFGGTLSANAKERRDDEYGTSYAIHAKGQASITIGSLDIETVPTVKGIKFESSGVNTELPTIKLVKGKITNPIYSMEAKYNYHLFKLDIVADAPVTFTDDTAKYFLADDLQMTGSITTWTVTSK